MTTPDTANLGSFNQILISFAQFFCYLWYFILIIVVSVDVYGQLIGGRVVVRGFAEDLLHGLFEFVDASA